MPKVSVIIPIYNVEKYLERCLKSVINQSLKDLEIICVNDGSEDKCIDILNFYQDKDSRIIVINKKNGGLSSARNAGIKIAKGEYIYFIDPDDYIESWALEELIYISQKNNCDVVLSGYKTNPTNEVINPLYDNKRYDDGIKMILDNNKVHTHNDLCFVWRCIFKSKLINDNNILFKEDIKIGEDFIFNLEVLSKSKGIYVSNKCFYNYTVDNNNSLMKTPYKSFLEDSIVKQYEIKKELSIKLNLYNDKNYRRDMSLYYINSFLPMLLKNFYNGPERNKSEGIKRIINYKMFRESCKNIGLLYKCSNYKEYIAYLAIKFKAYKLLNKIYDKQYANR